MLNLIILGDYSWLKSKFSQSELQNMYGEQENFDSGMLLFLVHVQSLYMYDLAIVILR